MKIFGIGRSKKKLSDTLSWNNSVLKDMQAGGVAQTDEGLNTLRGLDGNFRSYIAAGGLTPELGRQFNVAQGQLGDQYARSARSLRAALEQRRLQSGGQLTPQAVAEMEKEGQQTADEQYFGATNDLATQKATLSFEATRDWYSRLQGIAETMRTTGLSREQAALAARLQLASMPLQRRQVAISGLTSLFGGSGTKAMG